MKYGSTATPQQVADMSRVISAYCRQTGIPPGTDEEREVAAKVLALYEVGVRGPNDLMARLILPSSGGLH